MANSCHQFPDPSNQQHKTGVSQLPQLPKQRTQHQQVSVTEVADPPAVPAAKAAEMTLSSKVLYFGPTGTTFTTPVRRPVPRWWSRVGRVCGLRWFGSAGSRVGEMLPDPVSRVKPVSMGGCFLRGKRCFPHGEAMSRLAYPTFTKIGNPTRTQTRNGMVKSVGFREV